MLVNTLGFYLKQQFSTLKALQQLPKDIGFTISICFPDLFVLNVDSFNQPSDFGFQLGLF